jgi:hypothetical protein
MISRRLALIAATIVPFKAARAAEPSLEELLVLCGTNILAHEWKGDEYKPGSVDVEWQAHKRLAYRDENGGMPRILHISGATPYEAMHKLWVELGRPTKPLPHF